MNNRKSKIRKTKNTMLTQGVKGSDVYKTTGNKLVDLASILNRGLPNETIKAALTEIFTTGDLQDKVDAFVLAFQTRDIRGGKGERDLFTSMLTVLQTLNKEAVKAVIPLIPMYGCWGDLFNFGVRDKMGHLTLPNAVKKTIVTQLFADEATPPGEPISLLAKWLPREHSNIEWHRQIAKDLSNLLHPNDPKAQEKYRKRVSALNKRINPVEISMCAKAFASIEPEKVPGRALKLYNKAFLNKSVNRRPVSTDLDRITCAQNFRDHFALAAQGKAKVNGSHTVYPHEMIRHVLEAKDADDNLDLIRAMWQSLVQQTKTAGALSRTLAMCDFSGSMAGIPMEVSMALGILIAECNTGVFANQMLTFDTTPTLHTLIGDSSAYLYHRVAEVRNLSQGLSTDFQAAYNLVLKTLKERQVQPGDEPKDIIVLTDMGWDQAKGFGNNDAYNVVYSEAVKTKPEETHIQIARRAFQLEGDKLFGTGNGWKPPRIIIWNLRPTIQEFHCQALEEGVIQVAGWSPSLLTLLTTKGADAMTPTAMLRAQLDDDRYTPVHNAVLPYLM